MDYSSYFQIGIGLLAVIIGLIVTLIFEKGIEGNGF